jgi:DNA polymerase-1
VQASAADWTAVLLAGLRRRLAQIPVEGAGAVTAAAHLVFGATQVRFPMATAVVECYADAK